MTEEEKKEFKAAVREAMREIAEEVRLMPVAAKTGLVTEIIIRVGPTEAVQVLGGGMRLAGCPGPICYEAGMKKPPLDSKTKDLLQVIQEKTGESADSLVDRLDSENRARQLAEQVENLAKEMGIEQPE